MRKGSAFRSLVLQAVFLCYVGLIISVTSLRHDRQGVFQIVRFKNSACNTSTTVSGTCYTDEECTALGGSGSGSCASGYGVCCTFSKSCGGTVNQNNTYFASSTSDSSSCTLKICKCSSDICQIRLDFETFNIAQPEGTITSTSSVTTPQTITRCLDAQFTATSQDTTLPTICGTNSGLHMILEAEEGCNSIAFSWTNASPREWNIKISQISCNYANKPPVGCTQYHTGSTGTIQSYNYAGGVHLADQNVKHCFRTEQSKCCIVFLESATGTADKFGLTNSMTDSAGTATTQSGTSCLTDYVRVPGSFTTAAGSAVEVAAVEKACGSTFPTTVKSCITPFELEFITNAGDMFPTNVATASQTTEDFLVNGYLLDYGQIDC